MAQLSASRPWWWTDYRKLLSLLNTTATNGASKAMAGGRRLRTSAAVELYSSIRRGCRCCRWSCPVNATGYVRTNFTCPRRTIIRPLRQAGTFASEGKGHADDWALDPQQMCRIPKVWDGVICSRTMITPLSGDATRQWWWKTSSAPAASSPRKHQAASTADGFRIYRLLKNENILLLSKDLKKQWLVAFNANGRCRTWLPNNMVHAR